MQPLIKSRWYGHVRTWEIRYFFRIRPNPTSWKIWKTGRTGSIFVLWTVRGTSLWWKRPMGVLTRGNTRLCWHSREGSWNPISWKISWFSSPTSGTRILMRSSCNTRIHRVIFNITRLIRKRVTTLLSRLMTWAWTRRIRSMYFGKEGWKVVRIWLNLIRWLWTVRRFSVQDLSMLSSVVMVIRLKRKSRKRNLRNL